MKARLPILILILLFSFPVFGQEPLLPQYFETESTTEILKLIKKHYNARLAYDVTSLRSIDRSVSLEGNDLETDLKSLLEGTGFEFKLLKNTYLIIPSPKPEVPNQSVVRRNFSISGRVKDVLTGEALPFASVNIAETNRGVSTNLDGSFHVSGIQTDTLSVCASYLGYRTACISLKSIIPDKELVLLLERNNTFLPAVEITSSKERGLRILEQGQLIEVEPTLLSRVTVNGQADLFKAVQFLPGISSGDGLEATLNIRGSEEDENLILWDGFKVYHQNHFFGVFSTLNPNAIKNIQVHKGAYGSRYGGRSGGVLEVTGRTGDLKKRKVKLGIDLIGTDLSAETPLSSTSSLLINVRRSHSDYMGTPLFNELLEKITEQSVANDPEYTLDLSETDPKFFYYDFNLKFTTGLSPRDYLNISLFNGRDYYENKSHYQYSSTDGSPRELNDYFIDDSTWGNTGIGATWTHNMENGRYIYSSVGLSDYSSSYLFSKEEQDFLNGNPLAQDFSSTLQNNELKDLTIEHRQVFPKEKGNVELGYSMNFLELRYGITDREQGQGLTLLLDSTVNTFNHILYLDREWMLDTRWTIEAGVRGTVNTYTNRLYAEPRVLISYALEKGLSFRTGGGNYIQTIRRSAEQNLFLRQPDHWVLSSRDQFPEARTFQGILGMNWKIKNWQLDIEGFYKKNQGGILNQEQMRFLTPYTSGQEGIVEGRSEIAGVDVFLNYKKAGHDLWLAYSYTASFNYYNAINEGRAFPSIFNKPNDLKMIYSYSYLDYIFSTDLIYSTGYSYTPLLGTFQNDLTGQTFVIYGDDLSARLPDFFRWDLSLQRTFYGERSEWVLGFGIYNVTNQRNVRGRKYNVDQARPDNAEELTISAVDLELIGFTPNFILKFSFQ